MTSRPGALPDPAAISNRTEFAAALTRLRTDRRLTVRQVVERSGCLHGTVSGWFAGYHVPTEPNEKMFRDVLAACGIHEAGAQDEWLGAVRRVRPTTGRRRDQGPVPYRGLESFDSADAEWFFGRTELTDQVRRHVDRLRQGPRSPRILVVTGASGAGKSSLLRAGLVPELRRTGSTVAVHEPGAYPLRASAIDPNPDVIVIDQFEEIWTLCQDAAHRAEFLNTIAAPTGTVHVLGVRADFYRHAAEEPVLHDALAHHTILVGPLSREALRRAIVEPARKANWSVDDDLVHLLLLELAPRGSADAHDSGALPLLSHALLQTWQLAGRRRMTIADYNAAGGITGAIEQTAERAYAGLTDAQRQIARRTFLRLLTVEEGATTRRRVHRAELFFDRDSVADVNTVIDRFATQRLLTVAEESVEISHEALIGAWSRLGRWVSRDREGLSVHRRLTQATQVWLDNDHDPSALLGPVRLEIVQEWARAGGHEHDLNRREREYMSASAASVAETAARERRRTRILQRMVAGLAAALVAASALAAVALAARSASVQARDEAMSRQIAGQAQRLRETDPAVSAQLALAAFRKKPTLEARSALLDSSAVHTPIRLPGPEGGTLTATDASGTLLAVGRSDGVVDLHRLSAPGHAERRTRLPAPPSGGSLTAVTIAAAAPVLATAFRERIDLWDIGIADAPRHLATVATIGAVGAADSGYRGVALTPDGGFLAAATTTSRIARWALTDPVHPAPAAPLDLPAGAPTVTFSPDGRVLAAAGNAGALRMWRHDGIDPVLLADLPPDGSPSQALALRFGPDGTTLAAPGRPNDVRRWDVRDLSNPLPRPPLTGFTSYVNDLAFSADGARVAAGSSDNTTRVWRLDTGRLEMQLPNPAVVVSVQFADSGRALVTGSIDGAVRIWPLPGPLLRGAASVVFQTPIDRTGRTVLVGTGAGDGRAHLWNVGDPAAPAEYAELPVGPDEKTCGAVALSFGGTAAAVGTRAGRAVVYDIRDPAHPHVRSTIAAVNGVVGSMAFTPDATLLAVAGQDDSVVTLWDTGDLSAPRPLAALPVGPGLPSLAAFDATGGYLAVSTSDERVRLWDVRDRAHPSELPNLTGFTNDVASVAFSPDGRMVAAGSKDHTVRLYDLADIHTPRTFSVLDGPADGIISLSFSPDGDRLVGGASDSGAWVWDIADPRRPHRVATLTASPGRVNDAVYGLDGHNLIGGGPDGTVRIWTTDPDAIATDICHSGTALLTDAEWSRYLPGITPHALCGD
ncbi:hypothetical protein [Nocardia sp. BMG51109]|uniref:NACHT and WD repeat domain-containing protein n=1 Tax=Nocardia sp. BMG51109 TaxID=1056816 RepID=UPI0004641E77|nr:hypothetical protein [Nocardia sp. BMG51109]